MRVDVTTNSVTGRMSLCAAGECRVGSAAAGEDRAWVIDCCSGEVREINPVILAVTGNARLGKGIWGMTSDGESVRALHQETGRFVRLEPGSSKPAQVIKTKMSSALYPEPGADSLWFYANNKKIVGVPTATEKIASRITPSQVRAFAVSD
ncbi:MAG: hypothetical protein WEB19_04595 [Acidimicrobiia bacterium]